jgi:hypothetical protein
MGICHTCTAIWQLAMHCAQGVSLLRLNSRKLQVLRQQGCLQVLGQRLQHG